MGHVAAEVEIRALVEDRVRAVREKDVDKAMRYFAPDVMTFDVVGSLRNTGTDAVRGRVAQWFSSFEGAIEYEVGELEIAASNEVAFTHSLNHVNAAKTDGVTIDMWWWSTVCYRKLYGGWVVTHEHNSVPFDAGSGKVSLDLKP